MKSAYSVFTNILEEIADKGLFKAERILTGPQGTVISPQGQAEVLNLCANNYLGLANDPRIIAAARSSYDDWGFGLASVRFICGTQDLHKQLEKAVSQFLGMDDTILYSSCFDANTGLFETLLTEADAVISDQLNHASIIDGIRLCKAKRFRYLNNDMADLKKQLEAADQAGARIRLIVTDGIFSMDGTRADLAAICDLADEFDALVMVDDSHAVGFVGPAGKGTPEACGVSDRIDILTGTFGKALGGASGGYTSARQPIVDLLRQRSRPYLFSNTLAPAVVAASLKVLELLQEDRSLLKKLTDNTSYFRQLMTDYGLDIIPGDHPIVPVMIYDEAKTVKIADYLLSKGIYVIGFTYPVVPLGQARIRTQVSAAHSKEQLAYAASCFKEALG